MQAPDTKVAELIDGELVVSPRPSSPHGNAATVIGIDVAGPFHRRSDDPGGPGGWWMQLESELHLRDDVVVPDWAGWRHARMPALPNVPFFTEADWVCEVISPSTGRLDRSRKMLIYGRAGVAHCWLVDSLLRTLEVYRLEHGHWTVVGVHADDAVVRAEPFDAVALRLDRWWLAAAPAESIG